MAGHREVVGKPLFEALPELRHQGFETLLQTVRTSGQPFIGSDVPIEILRQAGGPLAARFLDFVYQPAFGPDKPVTGLFVQGHDKGWVELHGGHVGVDSPGLERGCVFTVRLPIHGPGASAR